MFLDDYGSVPIAALEVTGAGDVLFTRWSSEEETSCAIFQKGDMTVQRCKISDESIISHALPMGEHLNIASAGAVIYLRVQCSPCRRLHLHALWMLKGDLMFFGRGLFRGLRHPWLGKEMDIFTFSIITLQSARYLPSRFWITHTR